MSLEGGAPSNFFQFGLAPISFKLYGTASNEDFGNMMMVNMINTNGQLYLYLYARSFFNIDIDPLGGNILYSYLHLYVFVYV